MSTTPAPLTILVSLDSLLSPLIHSLRFRTWQYILEPFLGPTAFTYSEYLRNFLYTNNIPLALNNLGLLITTRGEIDHLKEKQEDMFMHALKRCFQKTSTQSMTQPPRSNSKKPSAYVSKRQTDVLDQCEADYRGTCDWLRSDLRKWLKSLRSATHIQSIIACVDMTQRETEFLINKCLKLNQYFDAIISSSSLPKPKPHPQVYQYALEHLQLDPHTNVMCVEASLEGIIAAKMAGITCIIAARLETPSQKQKEKFLVADHEDQVREESMQMLHEGAFTVVRDLEHLKGEYLGPIFSACQKQSNAPRKDEESVDETPSGVPL